MTIYLKMRVLLEKIDIINIKSVEIPLNIMSVHADERRYCGKTFTQQGNLNKRENTDW